MSAVDELKAQGNAAFSAKEYTKAISLYSDAIEMDDTNYTLYSNRSGAFCAAAKYMQAEADARKVIQLKPDWVRGYTRLGAALQGQEKWEDMIETLKKAQELDPNNENIKADIRYAQEQMNHVQEDPTAQLFNAEAIDRLRMNPKVAPYFNDPTFVAMINDIKANPKNISKYSNDQRIMVLLQALLEPIIGQQAQQAPPEEPVEEVKPKPAPKPAETKPAPPPTGTNPESEKEKDLGNADFKAGNLESALAHYDKAIELDKFNVTYYNNKATVLSKQGKFEEAIKLCEDAIAMGREHNANFESIARAYQKIASAKNSLDDIDGAIEALNNSLLEKNDPQVRRQVKKLQDISTKRKAAAYENPELSEQAKNEGNMCFKNGDYPKAIEHYTEAIKRAPRNPALYSNRAAAYSKLGEMPMAIADCDKSLEIDPNFAKAYTRKAYCHYIMKEYYKAKDCYNQALKIDPNNADAISGLQSVDNQIMKNRYSAPDEEQIKRAMQDPEIQRIIQDPGMQQILKEMQENPMAAQQYLADPKIREAFGKLQAAGIIR